MERLEGISCEEYLRTQGLSGGERRRLRGVGSLLLSLLRRRCAEQGAELSGIQTCGSDPKPHCRSSEGPLGSISLPRGG